MNIQLYFLRVRNVWKQIFRFFERRWKRNTLWTFFLVVFFVSGFYAHAAWASERPSGRVPVRETERVLSFTSRLQRDRSDWVSVTTTSTTTLPPVKKKQPLPAPIETPRQVAAPQGDWVAQCHAWAAQAGIELPPAAITLIDRESDCGPTAQNPTSSACGIAQNIRGCNSPGYGYDPIAQLKWMHGYVMGRYGSWENALAHSLSKNWY